MGGMPLAYLSGRVPFAEQWKCMDMSKDICYFGIRSYEEEEEKMLNDDRILVFKSSECHKDHMDLIESQLDQYFAGSKIFWTSFDIDAIDSREFRSTGTAVESGIALDFAHHFFSRMASRTVGMDLTEVNF